MTPSSGELLESSRVSCQGNAERCREMQPPGFMQLQLPHGHLRLQPAAGFGVLTLHWLGEWASPSAMAASLARSLPGLSWRAGCAWLAS